MRLATLRRDGETVAVRQDGDSFVEIPGFNGLDGLLASADWESTARQGDGPAHEVESADLAPLVSSGKVLCVGLNYRNHILEMGRDLPEYPTLFSKFPETLIGDGDGIVLPPEDSALDWEAELAVVIGREGRRIPQGDATGHIAGFSICNDISMRTWQFRTKEWLQGKNWESSTPLGPVMVTPDEWSPGGTIRTVVDGEVMQEASTGDLLFDAETLVSYISTMITLHPGDVIITGTPGGVGRARTPEVYLTAGQLVETSIEGIGTLRNRVIADPAAKAE